MLKICQIFFLFLSLVAVEATSALETPRLQSRVNDYANLLSPEQARSLDAKLHAHESRTSNQIVVLILPGLEGENLEEFSVRVGREWGLGEERRNNGVLLLIALEERAIRIEVGYGLEGALTDAESGLIIRNILIPAFQRGDFNRGIEEGIDAIDKAVAGEFQAEPPARGGRSSGNFNELFSVGLILLVLFSSFLSFLPVYVGGMIGGMIGGAVGVLMAGNFFIPMIAGFFLGMILPRLFRGGGGPRGGFGGGFHRGRGWSVGRGFGGFGGGGGFKGGGGGFGGGGASGRW